jgi:hypothetical protein
MAMNALKLDWIWSGTEVIAALAHDIRERAQAAGQ